MRTLVIAGDYPWPEVIGPRIRLSMVLRALRRCGDVELFSVISRFRGDVEPPDPELGLDRVTVVGFDNRPPRGLSVLRSAVRPGLPLGLPIGGRPAAVAGLARAASGRYDLVWVFGARPWVLCDQPRLAPTVLDLDDLEDEKIAARLAVPAEDDHGGPVVERLRRFGAELVGREEIRRWRRLHRRADHRVDAVTVCSPLDARRAEARGLARVTVVPNGYRPVDEPLGRVAVGDPPTVLFQGLLRYPANIEAARWLVRDVMPRLRRQLPEVRLRLVGDPAATVEALDDRPAVTVVGPVPDMADELVQADVVVVPVRYGSGTRIKILESFAHRIPVASTTVGAEGLEVEDGAELLIGDTADALAAALARLLTDEGIRRALTERAHRRYLDRYRSDVVEAQIAELATRVAGGRR